MAWSYGWKSSTGRIITITDPDVPYPRHIGYEGMRWASLPDDKPCTGCNKSMKAGEEVLYLPGITTLCKACIHLAAVLSDGQVPEDEQEAYVNEYYEDVEKRGY